MKPTQNFLKIQHIPEEETTKAGIYIAGTELKTTIKAEVLAVGIDTKEVKAGDVIIYNKGVGSLHDGFVFLREHEAIAID